MGWGIAGLVGTSIIGGILGEHNQRKAARQQWELLGKATGTLDDAYGRLGEDEENILSEVDAANLVLASIEPAVLAGMDEQLRIRVAQQVRSDQQAAQAQQQRLAQGGLDATTVAPALQRGQQYAQSDQTSNIAANFAGQRAGLLAGARTQHAQGLMGRASVMDAFSQRRMGLSEQKAGMYFNTQIQPSNTGAQIGALGGSISNALFTNELLGLLGGGGGNGLGEGGMGPPVPPGFYG